MAPRAARSRKTKPHLWNLFKKHQQQPNNNNNTTNATNKKKQEIVGNDDNDNDERTAVDAPSSLPVGCGGGVRASCNSNSNAATTTDPTTTAADVDDDVVDRGQQDDSFDATVASSVLPPKPIVTATTVTAMTKRKKNGNKKKDQNKTGNSSSSMSWFGLKGGGIKKQSKKGRHNNNHDETFMTAETDEEMMNNADDNDNESKTSVHLNLFPDLQDAPPPEELLLGGNNGSEQQLVSWQAFDNDDDVVIDNLFAFVVTDNVDLETDGVEASFVTNNHTCRRAPVNKEELEEDHSNRVLVQECEPIPAPADSSADPFSSSSATSIVDVYDLFCEFQDQEIVEDEQPPPTTVSSSDLVISSAEIAPLPPPPQKKDPPAAVEPFPAFVEEPHEAMITFPGFLSDEQEQNMGGASAAAASVRCHSPPVFELSSSQQPKHQYFFKSSSGDDNASVEEDPCASMQKYIDAISLRDTVVSLSTTASATTIKEEEAPPPRHEFLLPASLTDLSTLEGSRFADADDDADDYPKMALLQEETMEPSIEAQMEPPPAKATFHNNTPADSNNSIQYSVMSSVVSSVREQPCDPLAADRRSGEDHSGRTTPLASLENHSSWRSLSPLKLNSPSRPTRGRGDANYANGRYKKPSSSLSEKSVHSSRSLVDDVTPSQEAPATIGNNPHHVNTSAAAAAEDHLISTSSSLSQEDKYHIISSPSAVNMTRTLSSAAKSRDAPGTYYASVGSFEMALKKSESHQTTNSVLVLENSEDRGFDSTTRASSTTAPAAVSVSFATCNNPDGSPSLQQTHNNSSNTTTKSWSHFPEDFPHDEVGFDNEYYDKGGNLLMVSENDSFNRNQSTDPSSSFAALRTSSTASTRHCGYLGSASEPETGPLAGIECGAEFSAESESGPFIKSSALDADDSVEANAIEVCDLSPEDSKLILLSEHGITTEGNVSAAPSDIVMPVRQNHRRAGTKYSSSSDWGTEGTGTRAPSEEPEQTLPLTRAAANVHFDESLIAALVSSVDPMDMAAILESTIDAAMFEFPDHLDDGEGSLKSDGVDGQSVARLSQSPTHDESVHSDSESEESQETSPNFFRQRAANMVHRRKQARQMRSQSPSSGANGGGRRVKIPFIGAMNIGALDRFTGDLDCSFFSNTHKDCGGEEDSILTYDDEGTLASLDSRDVRKSRIEEDLEEALEWADENILVCGPRGEEI